MSKATKVWFAIATALILIGLILFGGIMGSNKWDFTKLSTVEYETNQHEITKEFKAISVNTDTADITFVPSESKSCLVVCYEQASVKHSVEVKDGTLSIKAVDTRKWYEHIGINFDTPAITVYVPRGEYGAISIQSSTGDVEIPKELQFESIEITESTGDITNYASASDFIKLTTTTGDIRVENISAASLSLSVSTGRITASGISCEGDVTVNVSTGKSVLTDVTCKSLISNGSTGDITLTSVIATERFSIKRSTGDVKLEGCDAGELSITTDTGDVEGSLLSEKVFIANTDTGDKAVPDTISGGKCEVTTDTGDIRLTIK
ncbi:MAG: DUF4097 family beta strand repeat protein [Clostridia bacterium]|nr:DUF4097 family beta strand repeat protein [Clostridia bacterium]